MSIRKSIIVASLASAIALPVFATSGTTNVGGEAGVQFHAMPSTVTRAQVQKELAEWRKNPVTADGYRDVGGEAGFRMEQHRYDFRNGKFVHADSLRTTRPSPALPCRLKSARNGRPPIALVVETLCRQRDRQRP